MDPRENNNRSTEERKCNHPNGALSTRWVNCPFGRVLIKLGTNSKAGILETRWKTNLDIRAGWLGAPEVREVQSNKAHPPLLGMIEMRGKENGVGYEHKELEIRTWELAACWPQSVTLWNTCIRIPWKAVFKSRFPVSIPDLLNGISGSRGLEFRL